MESDPCFLVEGVGSRRAEMFVVENQPEKQMDNEIAIGGASRLFLGGVVNVGISLTGRNIQSLCCAFLGGLKLEGLYAP